MPPTNKPTYPLHLGLLSVLDDNGVQVVVEQVVGPDGIVRVNVIQTPPPPPTVLP